MTNPTLVVIGGGAAGFFGAITAAEKNPGAKVLLLEKSPELLAKVTISGGGRCNATHSCFDPQTLSTKYPRGGRELIGAFHRWQPRDQIAWFAERGVKLKAERDGRMFPVTDKSATIVNCLLSAAKKAGVEIRIQCGVASAKRKNGGGFHLTLTTREELDCDALLLATGGNQNSSGHSIAETLGHKITPLVPSLFTFNIADARLKNLSGISVPDAAVEVPDCKLRQTGPLLITHWGLSGPAILKLSAWGARVLAEKNYDFELVVNWVQAMDRSRLIKHLSSVRTASSGKNIGSFSPVPMPARLWKSLATSVGIYESARWGSLPNSALQAVADAIHASKFRVTDKSMFKEEFVTCGGVDLREVEFRTMESKLCPGLFFAGEVLDIDGVTGGFNFQAAWTTGYIAGQAMAGDKRKGDMKKSILAALAGLLAFTVIAADKEAKVPKNKWFMNGRGYADALELQKQTGANLFVYFERNFTKDEKGLCSWWEKKGLQHPDVQKCIEEFIKVKFTFPLSKDDQALADKWKINKCPVVMVIQTNGWHARAAVFDWPNNQPKLKDAKDIVQSIVDASAPHEFKGRKGATTGAQDEQPADAKK